MLFILSKRENDKEDDVILFILIKGENDKEEKFEDVYEFIFVVIIMNLVFFLEECIIGLYLFLNNRFLDVINFIYLWLKNSIYYVLFYSIFTVVKGILIFDLEDI